MDTEDLRQYKDELKATLEEVDNQLFEREVDRLLNTFFSKCFPEDDDFDFAF